MRRRLVEWALTRLERGDNVPALVFAIVVFCPLTREQENRILKAAAS